MTDAIDPNDVEASLKATAEKPAPEGPQRRKFPGKPKAADAKGAMTPPLGPIGGMAGLWRTLIGRPDGAPIKGETGLTFAFVVCLVGGSLLCIYGALPHAPLNREIGFGGPLIATLLYPVWGVALGAHARPSLRERLADNSYYLGFIFTQFALLVGFVPAGFGMVNLEAKEIIRLFGVALGASLVGLVARTILIQMSYTVDEAADVVTGEVSSLARQVSEQSSQVLDHFEMLVARLAITHSKLTRDLHAGMTTLTDTVTGYNAALRADAATLHDGVTAAAGAADRTAIEVERQQVHLAETVQAVSHAIEQLRGTLEQHLQESTASLRSTTEALEQQLQTSTQSLQATTGAVQRSLESLHEVPQLNDSLTSLGDRLAAMTSQVVEVGAKVGAVDDGVGAVGAQVTAVRERLAQVDDQTGAVAASVSRSLTALDNAADHARAEGLERAKSLAVDTDKSVAALAEVLHAFRRELDRLRV